MKTVSHALLAIVLGLAVLMPAEGQLQAASAGVLGGLEPASVAATLVVPVHGCHRSAQDSIDGWHRHVGYNCRAVSSGPAERNPYSRCRTRCKYVGPIKQCRQVCN